MAPVKYVVAIWSIAITLAAGASTAHSDIGVIQDKPALSYWLITDIHWIKDGSWPIFILWKDGVVLTARDDELREGKISEKEVQELSREITSIGFYDFFRDNEQGRVLKTIREKFRMIDMEYGYPEGDGYAIYFDNGRQSRILCMPLEEKIPRIDPNTQSYKDLWRKTVDAISRVHVQLGPIKHVFILDSPRPFGRLDAVNDYDLARSLKEGRLFLKKPEDSDVSRISSGLK